MANSHRESSGFWGSGWSFPPSFDLANNQLQLVHKEANINQSIDIILSTLRGERSVMPAFGSNLRAYLFENMDETTQGEIIESVESVLLDYEPRISVDEVNVVIHGKTEPIVEVIISYTVRKTNSRHNHVYPFAVNEANNLQLKYSE